MTLADTGYTKEELIQITDEYMIYLGERNPMVADRAKDTAVSDETGEEYLDFLAGIAV